MDYARSSEQRNNPQQWPRGNKPQETRDRQSFPEGSFGVYDDKIERKRHRYQKCRWKSYDAFRTQQRARSDHGRTYRIKDSRVMYSCQSKETSSEVSTVLKEARSKPISRTNFRTSQLLMMHKNKVSLTKTKALNRCRSMRFLLCLPPSQV